MKKMAEEKEKTETPKHDWQTPVVVISAIVGVTLIIVAIILSSSNLTGNAVNDNSYNFPENAQGDSQNSQTGGSPISKKNCRQEQVPYEEQETYYETVPYTDQECEDKQLIYKKDNGACTDWEDNWFSENTPAKYSCMITNLDSEGGNFALEIGFNVGSEQLKETQSKYIYPQSSETFYVQRDSAIDSCFCKEASIPTKQVCRDVIKYKDIARTRTVTKYKTEEVCD